jgi:hypothetical protein
MLLSRMGAFRNTRALQHYRSDLKNDGWIAWSSMDGRVRIERDAIREAIAVYDANQFIQSIGGVETARLFGDCDGFINGRFIRGDDVRRALRIIEGI